jgi:hypothetical protein
MWDDELSELHEDMCLVCGAFATTPEGDSTHGLPIADQLRELGWHSWHGRLPEGRDREVLLRVCPKCLATPRVVATAIRRRHGLAHMVDWLRSRL